MNQDLRFLNLENYARRMQELNEQFSLAFERFRPILEAIKEEEPTEMDEFMNEVKQALKNTALALLRSRKVWVATGALIQTVAAHYLAIPPEIWAAIDGLAIAVIGAIAWEDAAEKRGT